GGSGVHCKKSGCAHVEVADDATCMQAIRDYLSFFPSHCKEKPPRRVSEDPVTRRDDALLSIIPDSSRKPFDMMKAIEKGVGDGRTFAIQAQWGRSIVTVLARIGGRPVGIIGSQPMFMGGVLDVDAADKAAHFVNLCDSFNVPLVFLMDVPGFMIGSK